MKRILFLLATIVWQTTVNVSAQVPQLINYQGRLSVGGVNFNGVGQFNFALVDGSGQTTYWSNDGTSVNGSQPSAAVTLNITNGLYSVLLGDTTIGNMTIIPATVFTNSDVRIRVWFNDGTNGWEQLTPDQRIAAVGYALMAANVPDGSITAAKLAPGAVSSATIAPGSITSAQLASGAVTSSNLAPGAVTWSSLTGNLFLQQDLAANLSLLAPLASPVFTANLTVIGLASNATAPFINEGILVNDNADEGIVWPPTDSDNIFPRSSTITIIARDGADALLEEYASGPVNGGPGVSGAIRSWRSEGTAASPTAVLAGDYLWGVVTRSYGSGNGTAGFGPDNAAISIVAAGDQTDTNKATDIQLQIKPMNDGGDTGYVPALVVGNDTSIWNQNFTVAAGGNMTLMGNLYTGLALGLGEIVANVSNVDVSLFQDGIVVENDAPAGPGEFGYQNSALIRQSAQEWDGSRSLPVSWAWLLVGNSTADLDSDYVLESATPGYNGGYYYPQFDIDQGSGVATFHQNLRVIGTTDASSSTEGGAFTDTGGAAIAKQLYVGGNVSLDTDSVISGGGILSDSGLVLKFLGANATTLSLSYNGTALNITTAQ